MKNMKKLLVLAMCIGVLGSMTGCGNDNNAADGADKGTTNTTIDGDKNTGDGVIDNAVEDVTDGINDVTDDLTGNNTTDNTTNNANRNNEINAENVR